jgi:protoporphyrinogen oxidase
MNVGIVGGGILGVTLAYFLARAGQTVTVYEAGPSLGGLAGPLTLPDGVEVDRFYHAILSSDDHLLALCDELDLTSRLRFRPTRTAVFAGGQLHPMNGIADFLRFPVLSPLGRLRLGLTIVAAQRVRDWRSLDRLPVRDWLERIGGREVYRRFWAPMLQMKFDGEVGDTPATWIWSRLVRTRSTRRGVRQREECGHLVGGYRTLLDAMASRIETAGGAILRSTPVSHVVAPAGQADGVVVDGSLRRHDAVVITLPAPAAARLVPDLPRECRDRWQGQRYLGIVCPLLVADRPLAGVWTLNVADASALVTGVIETTTYIDPALVGGHHLVYMPKYVSAASRWLDAPADEIAAAWREDLYRMVPGARTATIKFCLVHRERFVEPLHPSGGGDHVLPFTTPIKGLSLATTAQIYPALTNGESVTRHARAAAAYLLGAGRR